MNKVDQAFHTNFIHQTEATESKLISSVIDYCNKLGSQRKFTWNFTEDRISDMLVKWNTIKNSYNPEKGLSFSSYIYNNFIKFNSYKTIKKQKRQPDIASYEEHFSNNEHIAYTENHKTQEDQLAEYIESDPSLYFFLSEVIERRRVGNGDITMRVEKGSKKKWFTPKMKRDVNNAIQEMPFSLHQLFISTIKDQSLLSLI